MSEYRSCIRWTRLPEERFVDLRYSRAHAWEFDGGLTVPASSAVCSVPLPYSRAENVDPEEAFVAAIASCHMLTFLHLAAKANLILDAYEDRAVGTMARNDDGRLAIATVCLSPRIVVSGPVVPADADIDRLHHTAHEECYIANSVRTRIIVRGEWEFLSSISAIT